MTGVVKRRLRRTAWALGGLAAYYAFFIWAYEASQPKPVFVTEAELVGTYVASRDLKRALGEDARIEIRANGTFKHRFTALGKSESHIGPWKVEHNDCWGTEVRTVSLWEVNSYPVRLYGGKPALLVEMVASTS